MAEQEFIETGYICSVHGLQGEVRVKTATDFPELRFCQVERFKKMNNNAYAIIFYLNLFLL